MSCLWRGLLVLALSCSLGTAAAAGAPPQAGRYVVRPGDSLWLIAHAHGVSLERLAAANGIGIGQTILAGRVLRVPAAGRARAGPRRYVVVAGDTLTGIAARFGVSLAALERANGVDPAAVLLVGRALVVPRTGAGAVLVDLEHYDPAARYLRGRSGFDVSFPDCGRARLPVGRLLVVGLNDGRPFTRNPCLAREYAWARSLGAPRDVYVNTAYSPRLLDRVGPACTAAAASTPGARRRGAYALGCSEAAAAWAIAEALSPRPTAWWLDVEPANSWSRSGRLNAAVVRGALEYLLRQSPAPVVGVYSHPAYWAAITGGWTTLNAPEWLAVGDTSGRPGCEAAFAAGPVWLVQTVARGRDRDTTC